MKTIIFIIAFLLSCTVKAQNNKKNKGILFENGSTLEQCYVKAVCENKLVFIYCYATWCGPCKMMTKSVFTDDSVAKFYNFNFICIKIDIEKGEGLELGKKNKIDMYPTSLFVDSTGKVLYTIFGASPKEQFLIISKKELTAYKAKTRKRP